MKDELLYQVALTLINGIGDINAKSLLSYCGSAEEIFKQKKGLLLKIPGIGEINAKSIVSSHHLLKRAEQEIKFIQQYKIETLFFTSNNYPSRLKLCSDGPIMLYYKGNANLNAEKIVAVVGTRKPSDYGKEKTKEIVADLKQHNVLILSGLAYGVDVIAHKTALDNDLLTVGVLGHGLDRIYPQTHDKIAKRMIKQGGLLTDFMSGTNPDAVNFPKRNRIVAGLCDALIMIESKRTGGSLITATIANSYNKDVFALPGQAGDVLAEGGNGLIKRNKAALIENVEDLVDAMQWQKKENKKSKSKQIPLMLDLSLDEKVVMEQLIGKSAVHLDELCLNTQMPISKISAILLQLEFSNLVKSKPGKMFELCH